MHAYFTSRLIRTLKEEEVHLNDYEDMTQARDRISHFFTQVYHQKRPHSALGYLTPIELETYIRVSKITTKSIT